MVSTATHRFVRSSVFFACLLAPFGSAHAWEFRLPPRPGDLRTIVDAIATDTSTDVLFTGRLYVDDDHPTTVVGKLSGADGHQLWRRELPLDPALDKRMGINAVAAGPDGSLYAVGVAVRTETVFAGDWDTYVVKFSREGAVLWERHVSYFGQYQFERADDVFILDGDLFIHTFSGSGTFDAALVRLNPTSGAELWHQVVGPSTIYGSRLTPAVDAAGNLTIPGARRSSCTLDSPDESYSGVTKIDRATGAILWARCINLAYPGSENVRSVAIDPANGAIITAGDVDHHAFFFRLSASDGLELGRRSEPLPAGTRDNSVSGIRTVAPSDLLLVGQMGERRVISARRAEDFGERWGVDCPGTTPLDASMGAIDAGFPGDTIAYVFCNQYGDAAHAEQYIARFRASDGALLWRRSLSLYEAAQITFSDGYEFTADSTGAVLFGGISAFSAGVGFVRKLRAEDGGDFPNGGRCGDGHVEGSEACDEGAGNGTGNCCTADCTLIDADADGVCNRDDVCAGQAAPTKFAVVLAKLQPPAGDESLSVQAEATLPGLTAAGLDPVAHGVGLRLSFTSGSPIVVTLPAGAYDPATRAGWKVKSGGSSTTWAFRGTTTSPSTGTVRLSPATGALKVRLSGRGTWTSGPLPLMTEVILSPTVAPAPQCVRQVSPPTACSIKEGNSVRCKS